MFGGGLAGCFSGVGLEDSVHGVVGASMFALFARTPLLRRGLPPAIAPCGAEQAAQARLQMRQAWQFPEIRQRDVSVDHHIPRDQLLFDIFKDLFRRKVIRFDIVGFGQIAANHLQHVVQQQAKGELKDTGFRSAADQPLQAKDVRYLLKNKLDPPAVGVQPQQIVCGILGRVQQVRDQNQRLRIGTFDTNHPHAAAMFVVDAAQVSPRFNNAAAVFVGPRALFAARVTEERRLRMITDQKVVAFTRCEVPRLSQVAERAVTHPQTRTVNVFADHRHQVADKPHVVGVPVFVCVHADSQLRSSSVARPDPKDPADEGLFFLTKYGQP